MVRAEWRRLAATSCFTSATRICLLLRRAIVLQLSSVSSCCAVVVLGMMHAMQSARLHFIHVLFCFILLMILVLYCMSVVFNCGAKVVIISRTWRGLRVF